MNFDKKWLFEIFVRFVINVTYFCDVGDPVTHGLAMPGKTVLFRCPSSSGVTASSSPSSSRLVESLLESEKTWSGMTSSESQHILAPPSPFVSPAPITGCIMGSIDSVALENQIFGSGLFPWKFCSFVTMVKKMCTSYISMIALKTSMDSLDSKRQWFPVLRCRPLDLGFFRSRLHVRRAERSRVKFHNANGSWTSCD